MWKDLQERTCLVLWHQQYIKCKLCYSPLALLYYIFLDFHYIYLSEEKNNIQSITSSILFIIIFQPFFCFSLPWEYTYPSLPDSSKAILYIVFIDSFHGTFWFMQKVVLECPGNFLYFFIVLESPWILLLLILEKMKKYPGGQISKRHDNFGKYCFCPGYLNFI